MVRGLLGASVLAGFRGPVRVPAFIVTASLAIRIVLMPALTYDFDIWGWGTVIQNIESGNDLYQVAGYYYTPVWGYIVGTLTLFQDVFGPDLMGARLADYLWIEGLSLPYHTATTMSTGFLVFIKAPLVICDFAVAYVLYWLVCDRAGDKSKGMWAAAMWLMSPIVIYMSGIQAQFDTVSALMMLLAAVAFYRDRCLAGGALLSVAVLLKFFPGFCLPIILAYVWVRHRDDGLRARRLLEAVAGMALMATVMIAPQVANGTFADSLSFIYARAADPGPAALSVLYKIGMAVAVAAPFYLMARMLWVRPEGRSGPLARPVFGRLFPQFPGERDLDSRYFRHLMLVLTCVMFLSITPQYVIVLLPLLILHAVSSDWRMARIWALVSIAPMICALALNNYSLFTSATEFLGFASPDWVRSGMMALEERLLGQTLFSWVNFAFQLAEVLGFALILAACMGKTGRGAWVWGRRARGGDDKEGA